MTADLLARVLQERPPAYALLHRPASTGDALEVLLGEMSAVDTLAEIQLPEAEPEMLSGGPGTSASAGARHEVLAIIPYRQIRERGFAAPDDGASLLAMAVAAQERLPLAEALRRLPDDTVALTGGSFAPDDEQYADLVRTVLGEEIGRGEGANFVLKRSFVAEITGYGPRSALSFFRRLLERESGAYWTYLVHTGTRTFVGASPERHISLHDGTAVMNPISGTYRYSASGPALPEVMAFLADRKESDELYMVVDEELKMMARLCDERVRVVGPYLREMTRLAHTEYFIEGRTSRDVREILRETLFAPTVTGSPLESAAKVIARYEPEGRGYYSGVLALIGRDDHGARALDSAILIRTADIDISGRISIGVGATLVRHSDPVAEAAETQTKAAGLLAALRFRGPDRFADHPQVREALARRNDSIAGFWLGAGDEPDHTVPALAGRKVLVVDAEDTFTSMIEHQLRSMGLEVTVRRFDEPYGFDGYDLVVMGPGPGNPRDADDPKIDHLRSALDALLEARRPFLAICLSHQVLTGLLGLDVVRRAVPNQGVQLEIDLFGRRERVGFYNTFAARSGQDKIDHPRLGAVQFSRDSGTDEIHALRGQGFASLQFHPESVLTEDGLRIVGGLLTEVLDTCVG
ncbi:anthranilate synthase family protein [Streptomyces anthocyanicus]|uniref:anthranilate synthase family protein n=1 Tax=Streptomyces anthocyanicus TaxID=68174 RepID=UPI002F90A574|nr:anthranilate synthase family protein [Streptomyces anthocyanicus]